MGQNNSIYYIKLILAILFWALLYHVAKPAATEADPYLVAFLRYCVAGILFLAILKYKNGTIKVKLRPGQWGLISLIGLIGVASYNLLFFNAERLISGNIVAILYSFAPCLTTIISVYVFKTKLHFYSKVGVLIALCGSILVVIYSSPHGISFGAGFLEPGELCAILATLIFAIYSVLCKYTSLTGVSAIIINSYGSIIGAMVLGLVAIFKADFTVIPHLSFSFWLSILYMAVIATVLSYLWYTEAIINLGVFKTVIFQNTLPLQTILLGFLFFDEGCSLGVLISGIIIIIGVYLTNIFSYKA